MSGGFEKELKIVARAYNQAQQGLQATAQGIENIAKSAVNTAAATAKLNQAFGAAVAQAEGFKRAANGLYLPISQAGDAADKAGKSVGGMGGHAGHARDAVQDLYMTLGTLGFIRGFQVALTGLIGTYREFNATVTQASMIADDYAGVLERSAMTAGKRGPQELATVYRDIGSAGLQASDVIASSVPVMQFATAAMIDQSDAAQAVIAAASSFKIPFTEADRITNAFAEAMNRTTLGGRDLVYALASIGPVAGMAEQGLGQTLGAVAALRNAGAHAQDAATSVRAAMLHLSAPSDEARDAMKALGIEVFDASGRMKQWSEIVREFETALAPYNQQTRQMALTTILGSDGIRAMAASMQMGSGRLEDLAAQFENADGSARRMSSAMEETLDGTMRRVTGNIDRAAIAIGSDLEPAIVSVLGFIDKLVSGFVHLDDASRKVVEVSLGAAGVAVALTSVASIIKMLSPSVVSLAVGLNKLGPAITSVTVAGKALTLSLGGVVGIVGVLAVALGLAYGAWRSYQEGQHRAALQGVETAKTVSDQRDRLRELSTELETLASRTSPTNEEQNRLKQLTGEIAKLAPEAAAGIDQMTGRVTDLGKVLAGTNTAMDRMLQQSSILAKGAVTAAQGRLPDLQQQRAGLESKIAGWTEALQPGNERQMRGMAGLDLGLKWQEVAYSSADKLRQLGTNRLSALVQEAASLGAQIAELEAIIEQGNALRYGTVKPSSWDAPTDEFGNLLPPPFTPSGGKNGTDLFGGGGDKPTWISQWKAGFEAMAASAEPARNAVDRLGGELDILSAKQAYYLDLLADGKGGIEAAAGAENARVQIIERLTAQQDALHQANEAYRALLPQLQTEQERLDSLLASGAITAKDHAEASKTLRSEANKLSGAINDNSAAWWRNEQAITSAEAAAGKAQRTLQEAQQKLNDQAYQQATTAMRHEVAMKRLSVVQQITLLRQMLQEMTLSAEQAGAIQEQLVGLYGQKVRDELERVEAAYRDSMDQVTDDLDRSLGDIERRLQDTIGPLKAQLEALEGESRTTDRTRAAEDHNRRIADLQKDRQYHEKRMGREHQEALKRIDEQIAEENRRWQEQQDDWNLDDRKRAIEDEIEEAEEGAKREREQAQKDAAQRRKDLEAHYQEVKRLTEQGILDAIAALAATNPQWFTAGQTLIDQLIAGLESGDFSAVLAQINSVKAAADAAAAAAQAVVQSSGGMSSGTGTTATNPMGAILGAFNPFLGIGFNQVTTNIPGFASGAWEIPYDDMVARLHKGETVLPAHAAEAFRSFSPALSNLDRVITEVGRAVVQAIMSKPAPVQQIYGAQTAYIEDSTDLGLLSRQIARDVLRTQTP